MKRLLIFLAVLAIAAGWLVSPVSAAEQGPAWAVYFSPQGGCTVAIERELCAAKRSVYVQAYL